MVEIQEFGMWRSLVAHLVWGEGVQGSNPCIPTNLFYISYNMIFKPTYLYVKTHNITGLKYFGKTILDDVSKYKGSGVYWLRHIKKHGYDVTTEIFGYFEDEIICKIAAIQFSIDNDIVKSKKWANLKEERLDGGWDYINMNGLNLYENLSEDGKLRHMEGSLRGARAGGNMCFSMGVGIFALSEDQKLNARKKAKDAMYEKYGVESIFSIINKDLELNARKKEIFKEIGHQQGSKNSQYGSMWITDGILNSKIPKGSCIPDGWRKGRVLK